LSMYGAGSAVAIELQGRAHVVTEVYWPYCIHNPLPSHPEFISGSHI
jgi:hypothetical protein